MQEASVRRILNLHENGELPIELRGKEFGLRELRIIHQCISDYFEKGRTYISKEICKELDWKQPNGWLKDRACRHVLLRLEERGLLELPERLVTPNNKTRKETEKEESNLLGSYDFECPISEMPEEVMLDFAKGNDSEKVWNELVDEFHYLGHNVVVGRCIKYIVKAKGRLIGAVSFSSPAWQLTARDELLGELGFDQKDIRHQVINNSRFLILPHVKVENLASRVLAAATDKIVNDWIDYYAIRPEIAETFVQPSRYEGTCYKAANWLEVGTTKGYAKKGRAHHNSQEPKRIYLYGLNRKIRRELAKLISRKK